MTDELWIASTRGVDAHAFAAMHHACCNSSAVLTWQAWSAALCGAGRPSQQPSWGQLAPTKRCPASAKALSPGVHITVVQPVARWCRLVSGRGWSTGSLALQRPRLASGRARAARSGAAARTQVPQDVVHPEHGGAALVRLVRVPLWQWPPVRAGERLVDLRRTPPPFCASRAVLIRTSPQGSACMGHSTKGG